MRHLPTLLTAASVLGAVLLLPGPATAAAPCADEQDGDAHKAQLVELTITDAEWEDPAQDNPLGATPRNFREKLKLLRRIAGDPDIDGVILDLKGTPGWAKSLDMQLELQNIKDAGKRIVCYTEVLAGRDLAFASLADPLVVPPSALIGFEGLVAEMMYLKDALAKIDLRFEVLHVGEFKTAYEDLARDSMSDGQRTMLENILEEYYQQLFSTIAENRNMLPALLAELLGDVLIDPAKALEVGLIDMVAYEDEFDAHLEELFGEYEVLEDYGNEEAAELARLLDSPFGAFALMGKMLNPPDTKAPDEPHVAIVYATGAIMSGKSSADWTGRVSSMGSDTIVEALDRCYDDDNVKAVVLRVNSPGGSALASDMIWRAIERVRSKKPVISSMGSVAASGGYWISMGCDVILAQPSTLTGSIGVVSMLPDPSVMLDNLGVNVEVVAVGPRGDALSLLKHGVTPELRVIMQGWMERVYDEFIEKVAAGRDLQPDFVRSIAGGRVWTGRQAVENGLVDELGGLDDAIALACVMGGGLDVRTTDIMEYPGPPNFMEQLEEQMQDMASLRAPYAWAMQELGLSHLGWMVEQAVSSPSVLSRDRVMAILPYQITVR